MKMLDWSALPEPDTSDWHNIYGGQSWKHDARGVFLDEAGGPLRTPKTPITCQTILDLYGTEIHEACATHKLPPELILMTIATEADIYRASGFTGPSTFRWEPSINDYSAGPMQTLGSTARARLESPLLPKEWKNVTIPIYPARPTAPPSLHPLYEGRLSIWLGAAQIAANVKAHGTKFDPILVAACYNRGRLAQSSSNPWHLSVTRDHLDRAAARYGDACEVMAAARKANVQGSAPGQAGVPEQESLELYSLTPAQAEEEKKFYLDSGADVDWFDQDDGLVTLVIQYTGPLPGKVKDLPIKLNLPTNDGFVICVDRQREEIRQGKTFARTIGYYQAFFDKKPIQGLSGVAVERGGPGDNSKMGDTKDRSIEVGIYPLSTHAGASNKYKTIGYDAEGGLKRRPWPAIRVDDTQKRSGILIHCAAGYIMSVGCINLSENLKDASSDMSFEESRQRVIALIDGIRSALGDDFPKQNNVRIPNAFLEIRE
ncbi:hypothetical protein [Bosea sp. 685]|uniref:hypothetical protein n=1 Tax=Bosea sp. 685 TaxID=3080057 RepID=UPI0028936B23|nr:hypothetical protein [Bosea sp. 685]WNJ89588.1 hypothetical protein RMR04_24775 [Bosea sp. 685]